MYFHCAEAAGRLTVAALDTEFGVDLERALELAGDGIRRALAGAGRTADTLVFVDGVGDEVAALAGGAVVLTDVGFELIAEVPDGREDRVRGRLTETAERAVLDGVAQLFELLDVRPVL